MRARLPPAAHSLYYVDLIGNISSSAVRRTSAEVRGPQAPLPLDTCKLQLM